VFIKIILLDKRTEILEIATRLFAERGYENTPLSLICESAGVSKGLISHHFKSKDGLLREIFNQTTQLIIKINSKPEIELPPHKHLEKVLKSFFAQLEKDRMLLQFNLNMIAQPSTRAILLDLIQERSIFILDNTISIFDRIDPKNSLILSHMFIAELDGIALSYLGVYKDFPLKKIKSHIIKKYTKR